MSFVRCNTPSVSGEGFELHSDWTLVRWYRRAKSFVFSDMDGVQDVDRIQLERQDEERKELHPGFSQYDDFHTIDWQRDIALDRLRRRVSRRKETPDEITWKNKLSIALDACGAWICVSIVGTFCGIIAAVIDIGTGWLSDLKSGFCATSWWLNKQQCCWFSNSTLFEGDKCDEWQTWAYLYGYTDEDSKSTYLLQYFMHTLWAILFASLAALLVHTFAPYAGGGGIPEIKTVLSGFVIRGLLGKWTLIIKAVGVMLAVAAGLVLGKEGPLVHVACCIGNIVTYLFPKYGKNEAKKREILSAAAAAGVSVAFGAPIGGVLFSLEEVSYYFPLKTLWRTFFCALVASFILSMINPFGTDHMIVFYVNHHNSWVYFELVPFALLGVLGGFFASIFIKANVYWCKLRKEKKFGKYPITEVVVVTIVTSLLCFPNEYTRMDTSELIAMLVRNCGVADDVDICDYRFNYTDPRHLGKVPPGEGISNAMWKLTLAFVLKFVLLIVTVGMKIPAGLYIPSLAIGAIIGRMVGVAMEQMAYNYPTSPLFIGECGTDCITPGLYAMVGAAAFLGGVTRMTVGLVVIMFEVTGGVRYIVPLMVGVMTSKWVGDALSKQGIFEALIDLNDYPFLDSKEEFSQTTLVADVIKTKEDKPLIVLPQEGMTKDALEKILEKYKFNAFPIVKSVDSPFIVGLVSRGDLDLALLCRKNSIGQFPEITRIKFIESPEGSGDDENELNLSKIVNMAIITITDVTPMEMVVELFRKMGLRQVLVTHKGQLLHLITKKDVLRHIKQDHQH